MHIQSHLILFTMLTITLSEIWEDFILFYTLSFLKQLFLSLPEKQKCKNVTDLHECLLSNYHLPIENW